ncbi:hypothetical protein FHS16_000253 [Paenibacillus endophyticus]|uniref:Uncharacterized protein n=1 Tax=Paenibacillus endophyticus TaxID=1294268 RepID=A0A7W5G842_9BACL|nr:hypothetical protein [Paenibacillus endophyticus]MBB3150221.1 hypothetical protein [Paenibacillus endophyticus]
MGQSNSTRCIQRGTPVGCKGPYIGRMNRLPGEQTANSVHEASNRLGDRHSLAGLRMTDVNRLGAG